MNEKSRSFSSSSLDVFLNVARNDRGEEQRMGCLYANCLLRHQRAHFEIHVVTLVIVRPETPRRHNLIEGVREKHHLKWRVNKTNQ